MPISAHFRRCTPPFRKPGVRATSDMLSYFSEELTRNTSQGVQNIVSDVQLLKGELTESWEERDLQYATAYMRWRAHDYVIRLGRSAGDPEAIVSGNPRVPV